jgi:hypothetical protein
LHGKYVSFYSNGELKSLGWFKQGQKIGEWKEWYDNGKPKKIMLFNDDGYYLKEFYKFNGTQLVKNGNGHFRDNDILPGTTVKGEIKNGKQHGKWSISNHITGSRTAVETFDNGKFIEGQNIAEVKGFSEKYTDHSSTVIDLTDDLLDSYSIKSECEKNGHYYGFEPAAYNGQTTLPFFDYLYQRFDPPPVKDGYILASFVVDRSGTLTDVATYSTVDNKRVDDQLKTILTGGGAWEPKMVNSFKVASTQLFVFQFVDGTYKILNDIRNMYPPVTRSAAFAGGEDSLKRFVERKIILPDSFHLKGFNTAAAVTFHIDEAGVCNIDNSVFESNAKLTVDEKILYHALSKTLKATDKKWKPAMYFERSMKNYYIGVMTIKDGVQKFRLFSNNWLFSANEP